MGKFRKVENTEKKVKTIKAGGAVKGFLAKNMWCLIAIALTAIYLIATFLGVAFIKGQASNMPTTYYQTGNHENTHYSVMAFNIPLKTNEKLDSVWINLGSYDYKSYESSEVSSSGELYSDGTKKSIQIYSGCAKNVSSEFYDKENNIKLDNDYNSAMVGGYQRLYKYSSSYNSYNYFAVATANTVKINEIVFVGTVEDDDGFATYKVLKAKAYGSGAKGKVVSPGSDTWYAELESNENVIALNTSSGIKNASKLVDESSSFDITKLNTNHTKYDNGELLSVEDYQYINSARNLANGEGQFVMAGVTSLGSLLQYLAMLIVGTGAFGLRFFAVLFGAGTVILSYFIANKFIKGSKGYGLIASGVTAGVCFAIAIFAFNFMPSLFFFALSGLLVINFFNDKNCGGRKGLLNLIFSGLSFSFTIAFNAFGLFTILPLAAAIIYGIIIRNKGNGNSMALIADVLVSVVCFALLPCIVMLVSFLPSLGTIGTIVGSGNAFELIAKQIGSAFTGIIG